MKLIVESKKGEIKEKDFKTKSDIAFLNNPTLNQKHIFGKLKQKIPVFSERYGQNTTKARETQDQDPWTIFPILALLLWMLKYVENGLTTNTDHTIVKITKKENKLIWAPIEKVIRYLTQGTLMP